MRTKPVVETKREHQVLTKFFTQELEWLDELTGDAGTERQTVIRTLVRDAIKRKRKAEGR